MMRKATLTAVATGLATIAPPAAEAAPFHAASTSVTPFFLASAALFIPGLQLIFGLLYGKGAKAAAAA